MGWFVYMVRSDHGSLYTGVTNDLPHRLKKHREGKGAKYLRGKGFLTIAWHKSVSDKSEALREEAKVKSLSKKKKEELVLSSNPMLETLLTSTGSRTRDELSKAYSWVVPTEEVLREIAKLSPIVEMGAGTGYWASLLSQMGVDVVAYDRSPVDNPTTSPVNLWHAKTTKAHFEVRAGDPSSLSEHSDRTLLLCWPPKGSMAARCLDHWKGSNLVFIGDLGNVTADEEFVDLLCDHFAMTTAIQCQRTDATADDRPLFCHMTVWSRRFKP